LLAPLTQAYGPIRVELTVATDDAPLSYGVQEDQSPEAVRPAGRTVEPANRQHPETQEADEPLSSVVAAPLSSPSFRYAFVVSLPELPARSPEISGSSTPTLASEESIANPLHAKVRALLLGLFDEAATEPTNIQITLIDYPPGPSAPSDLVADVTPVRRADRPVENAIPLWLAIAAAAAGAGWMLRHWLAPSTVQRLPSIPRPLVEDTSTVSVVPNDSPIAPRRSDDRLVEAGQESPNRSLLDWASQNPQMAASSMEQWIRRAA
jgi:hypothetical protein